MSFLRKHLPPTLHNAAGTIIAALVLGIGGLAAFITPVRTFIATLVAIAVPLWFVLFLFAILTLFLILLRRKRKKTAAAAFVRMRVNHAQERAADHRRIADLEAQVEQLTQERDDAIEQKKGFMYRLQELSKRLGDVVSIKPASGAERTKRSDG